VVTKLKTALDALLKAFPEKDFSRESLGHELVRAMFGQYGIREDELKVMGLAYSSTVSSARMWLEDKLQQRAA
jgi:hypothetical protein